VGDTELFDDETGRSWLEVREIKLLLLLVVGRAELTPVGGLELLLELIRGPLAADDGYSLCSGSC
jgi:hypothetical protein